MTVVSLNPKNSILRNWSLDDLTYQDGAKVDDHFALTVKSESEDASTRDFSTQITWVYDRLLVLEAQKAIVNETFDFKGKSVAEFGSGAHGWFYNFMLPKRKNWQQFDINPDIVKSNKKFSRKHFFRFPNVEVGDMYNMPLESESLDVIVGFSSWDAIYFLEESADEVKRCLKPGGYFVHLQDISPADGPYLLIEAKKRKDKGMDTNFPVRFVKERVPWKFGYQDIRSTFGIDSIDWGEVRLGQYLNNYLKDTFQQKEFDIKTCTGIEKEVLVNSQQLRAYFENLTQYSLDGIKNSLGFAYGKLDMAHDDTVPNGKTKQWAYMDVFVAQKP